jgi:hypothetical protein
VTTSPQQPPPGLTVGGYTLLSRLGEGGMGVVHLAQRPGGERVALKVLRPHIVGDQEARARLAREVGSLSRIRSRWVAEIVDADPWGDIPYVATRYVPGPSLHELVAEHGPLTGDDLHRLAHGLAEGIDTIHAVGVLHRDVKPSNVLMEGRNPILIDFGLARVADDPRITHTGWLLGTPGFLAPEILHGDDASPASDLHSWAATVAYAGTGRTPFGRGPSMAIMDRVRRGQHDLAGLPADLREVLTAALDPDPERRPDLPELLAWLRDPHGVPLPGPVDDDPYTVPLALAHHDRDIRDARTVSFFDDDEPDGTRLYDEDTWPPEPQRTPFLQKARRAFLLAGAAAGVGAAVTAYPWLATAVLVLLTWFLRSASLAATATGARRQVRGAKWYDPVIYLVGAPWHVVRAIPGAILLVLWALGLALAVVLVCYAVAATVEVTLFVAGLAFALSLWMGPGGSRFRSPLARVVHPLSVSVTTWFVALLVVAAVTGGLGYLAVTGGPDWAPADRAPYSGLDLPQSMVPGPG